MQEAVQHVATDTNFYVFLTIIIGSLVPGLCIGLIAVTGLKAMSRNPEASASLQTAMVLAIAFAEAIAIYALVIALIIKFV